MSGPTHLRAVWDGQHPRYASVGNQQTAVARLLVATRQSGGLAVLSGPGGTGVTTVLRRLATDLEQAGHSVRWLSGRNLTGADCSAWPSSLTVDAVLPPVVLLDDAHVVAAGVLTACLHQFGELIPTVSVVLAGRGRLLTLLARERDLGERIRLRAVLRAWTVDETEEMVASRLAAAGVDQYEADVPLLIHAIAAGIPQAISHLLETVLLVAKSQPQHRLRCEDIERMHERLSLAAA